jgi:hypothetical protein
LRKLLKKQGFAPDVLVTDKLRSYGAAESEIGLAARFASSETKRSGRDEPPPRPEPRLGTSKLRRGKSVLVTARP